MQDANFLKKEEIKFDKKARNFLSKLGAGSDPKPWTFCYAPKEGMMVKPILLSPDAGSYFDINSLPVNVDNFVGFWTMTTTIPEKHDMYFVIQRNGRSVSVDSQRKQIPSDEDEDEDDSYYSGSDE